MEALTLILQALAAFGPDIPEVAALVQQGVALASQTTPVTNAQLADIFRNLAVVHDHLQALTAAATSPQDQAMPPASLPESAA